MNTKGLSVAKVLDVIFRHLIKDFVARKFVCRFACVIADDSDHHHSTRRGGMVYKDVYVIPMGTGAWVIARGHPGGGYLTQGYAGDIIAFKIKAEVKGAPLPNTADGIFAPNGLPEMAFAGRSQEGFEYFGRSAIVARSDGWLVQSSRSEFPSLGELVCKQLKLEVPFHPRHIPHRSEDEVDLTTFMPISPEGRYDQKSVRALVKAIKFAMQTQ